MKTNKYQWMKDLHLMTFVFVWLGILYLLILVFLWRIPICISSVFVIIIIFFAPQPFYSWERRKEKSDHIEFIMMMVILSCSSQWLTEAAFGRTLCICVFWPCICILALLMLCSCFVKPYFFTNKSCISWWIIIDHSMQHWLHWVHNCKSIIIWKEVFKCRIKRTGISPQPTAEIILNIMLKNTIPDGGVAPRHLLSLDWVTRKD